VTDFEIPATGSAEVHVLHEGYVGLKGDDERVSGTGLLRYVATVIIPGHGAPFRPGMSV
jgi:hypothetical protein